MLSRGYGQHAGPGEEPRKHGTHAVVAGASACFRGVMDNTLSLHRSRESMAPMSPLRTVEKEKLGVIQARIPLMEITAPIRGRREVLAMTERTIFLALLYSAYPLERGAYSDQLLAGDPPLRAPV